MRQFRVAERDRIGLHAAATTGSNGQCSISTSRLSNSLQSITMSVTNLSGSGFVYDSGANSPNPPTLSVNRP